MKRALLLLLLSVFIAACRTSPVLNETAAGSALINIASGSDDFSLDEVQRRTFNYFWETALPDNYQVPDRRPTKRFRAALPLPGLV